MLMTCNDRLRKLRMPQVGPVAFLLPAKQSGFFRMFMTCNDRLRKVQIKVKTAVVAFLLLPAKQSGFFQDVHDM